MNVYNGGLRLTRAKVTEPMGPEDFTVSLIIPEVGGLGGRAQKLIRWRDRLALLYVEQAEGFGLPSRLICAVSTSVDPTGPEDWPHRSVVAESMKIHSGSTFALVNIAD